MNYSLSLFFIIILYYYYYYYYYFVLQVYVHRDDFKKLVPIWMKKTEEIMNDKKNCEEAWTSDEVALHWCAEMFG